MESVNVRERNETKITNCLLTLVSHLFICTKEVLEDIQLNEEPRSLIAHKREKWNIFKTMRNTKQRVPGYIVEYCPVYPVEHPPVYTVK